ncbi:MAG: tRNA-dihydrouridine synthase family protein [Anaerolineales bacterium]|nr:tRNA-dihydrouridine synthase family protein [Anaerolineales bacterium]MCX7754643.1 tRNA-dihydrouridine synthase family protein [Anaerolineales bacterium]MDW8278306.1 tRNA-dihydrouridine synthase family protein [Anaerolineales bacterium]
MSFSSRELPVFFVRDIPVYGEAILAPMDGYSDWPFRSICRALGSAMSYTEFVKAEDIVRNFRRVRAKLTYEEAERPVVFQIYGDEPSVLLEAALIAQDLGPDIIDINMGCPAKSIAHRGCGVGLMRTPQKVGQIFATLSARLRVPVTGKMRLGWEDCLNYKEVARIAEENGAALIAVHGRTKQQGYAGQADWNAIAEVKALLKIPVVGNGDVRRVEDIARMKQMTGCDAVMIGRGAIANPWIFARLDREQVPPEQVRETMQRHLERNIAFYGREDGERLFRKHAMQYLGLHRFDRETRKAILKRHPAGEFAGVLAAIQAQMQVNAEAFIHAPDR